MDRLKALYLAEAGLSQAIWELKTNYDDPESERAPGNIPWRDVSDGPLVYGRYKTTHDFQTSTITSTAEVDKLQRTIQIKYASL